MSSTTKRMAAVLSVGAGLLMAAPAQAAAQTSPDTVVGGVIDNITLPRLSLPPGTIPPISPSPPINFLPKVDPVGLLLPPR